MADGPTYVILGRGRWAGRMCAILAAAGRRVQVCGETRRATDETFETYRSRITSALRSSGAQVAWLCVPPGEHIAAMMDSVLDVGLHAVVEPPWLCSSEQTSFWTKRAHAAGRILGVHYEYCLLDRLEEWRREISGGEGLCFGGVFHHRRSGHLGLPAVCVLGTHLLSIHEFAVPCSKVGQLHFGYELADERRVWLDQADKRISTINFLDCREPLIQRYICRLEAAMDGAVFPWGLQFAQRLAAQAVLLTRNEPQSIDAA